MMRAALALLVGLASTAWSVRLELGLVLVLLGLQRFVDGVLGWAAVALVVVAVLAVPRSRRPLLAVLRAMHVRRA